MKSKNDRDCRDWLTSLLFSRLFTTQLTISVTFLMICKNITVFQDIFFQKISTKLLCTVSPYIFDILFLHLFTFLYQKLQKSKKCYYFKMAPRCIFLRFLCTFQMQLVKRRHNMRYFKVQIWKFWIIPSILSIKWS